MTSKNAGLILGAIALFILVAFFVSGCAATVKDNRPQLLLEPGIRDWCGTPPKSLEGTAKRFDSTCMHYESQGPAVCGYIARVDYAKSWACELVLWQDECGTKWSLREMKCIPWADSFNPLIPHPMYEQGNE
jgi:hypothetical protein